MLELKYFFRDFTVLYVCKISFCILKLLHILDINCTGGNIQMITFNKMLQIFYRQIKSFKKF